MNLAAARTFAGNTGWSALAHLLMRGGLVIAFMVLSHRLTVEGFAELSYFNLALGYVAALSTLGLGPTTVRTFAADDAPRRDYEAGAELTAYIALAALVFIGAWLWGEPQISGLPGWTFAAILPMLVIGAFPQAVLNGRQDFRSIAITAAFAAAVVLGCSLSAEGEIALPIAVAGVAGAYFTKLMGEGVASAAAVRRAGIQIRRPLQRDVQKVLSAMSWLGLASIASAVGMWALASWMRGHLDNSSFGTFAIGLQWYAIGIFVAANMTRVLMPMQVQMAAEGRGAASKLRLLAIGSGSAVGVTMMLAVSAFLFQDLVASFYDSRLAGLSMAIVAFTVAAATAAPLNMIGNFAIAEGRDRLCALSNLAWLATVTLSAMAASEVSAITGAVALALANIVQGTTLLMLLSRPGLLR